MWPFMGNQAVQRQPSYARAFFMAGPLYGLGGFVPDCGPRHTGKDAKPEKHDELQTRRPRHDH